MTPAPLTDKRGTTIANVAAAWVLRQLGPKGGWVILGVRDTRHLDEHTALLESVGDGEGLKAAAATGLLRGGGDAAAGAGAGMIDHDDDARIRAVLDKGNKPRGDIWSHERGLA